MVEASVPRSLPASGAAPAAPLAGARRIVARLPRGERRRRLVWQTLWAPFWLGSDVPAPVPPAREPAPPAALGPAGEVVVMGLDQIGRRLWLRHAAHLLVRGLWLGLAIGCGWLVVELLGGVPFDPYVLGWIGGALLILAIIFLLLGRPSRRRTARMLDRSFDLRERLTTAVDHLGRGVPGKGERASVVYLQMADAANAVAELRRDRLLGLRVPVRELVLAIFFALLLATLFFLRGVGGDLPPLAGAAVPVFTPAANQPPEPEPPPAATQQPAELAPTVEEVRQRSEASRAAQRDLQALARALDDHAVTRPAAEAIGQGAYEQAGNELQELAPNADQLSAAAREALAGDLEQAAEQMSPSNEGQSGERGQDLGSAARRAAEGLRQGEAAAQEGVRDLGAAVERTGGEVASQQELADQMRQAQEADRQGQERRANQGGEPGEQGQAGQQGQQGQQGEPGQQGQQQGEAGEAGSADAQAASEGEPGEGAQGEGAQPGDPSAGAQPGEDGGQGGQPGEQPGQPGDGPPGSQAGAEGEPGAGGGEQTSGDGAQSEQGGGAGGGQGQEQEGPGGAPSGGGKGEEQAGQGAAGEEQIAEGDGEGIAGGEPAPVVETIQLPSAPQGEGGVQTSANAGSSSRGAGAGVAAGSGSTVPGEVGEAGPDSNRVPPDYREVVEGYFSRPEGGE